MNRYEIRLRGLLDSTWSNWFDGFALTTSAEGFTTVTGPALDQAALHGLLRRVGDLGLTLVSVTIVDGAAITHPATPVIFQDNAP